MQATLSKSFLFYLFLKWANYLNPFLFTQIGLWLFKFLILTFHFHYFSKVTIDLVFLFLNLCFISQSSFIQVLVKFSLYLNSFINFQISNFQFQITVLLFCFLFICIQNKVILTLLIQKWINHFDLKLNLTIFSFHFSIYWTRVRAFDFWY